MPVKAKKPSVVRVPDRANVIINANQMMDDLQRGVRHEMNSPSQFSFTVEIVQPGRPTAYWCAFVTQGGIVRAASKARHATPGGAIDELWWFLNGKAD